jgi:hypothetical protein
VSSKVEGRTVAEDSLQAAVAGGEPSSGSPRQRLLKALLSRPLAWRVEVPTCAALLAGVAFLVYRPHVGQGGFYSDDWANASDYRYEGWRMAVNLWHHVLPGRPGLAALLPLPYALFGHNAQAHLAMAVCLGALTSLCFYVFLRALTLEPIHAASIAILALIFPWSEAARLWPTASLNNLAVCAYLLGTVVALHRLQFRGKRAVLTHGAALALYLFSLVTYEVAGCAIALSVVVYRVRTSLRHAATRWAADLVLVVAVLSISAAYTSNVRHVGSLSQRIHDIPAFSRQGLSIFASSFLPRALDSATSERVALVVLGAIIAYAVVVARDPTRESLRRWLRVLAIAALGVAAAYVMFLGSTIFPSGRGLDTRLHVFAGLAFATSCYATVVVAVELVAPERRVVVALAAGGSLVLGLGFADRLRSDSERWANATRSQQTFVAALKQTLPRPAAGSTIFSFGYPGGEVRGLPIFSHNWDMNGVLRLTYHDPSLYGLPVYGRGAVVCQHTLVYVTEFGPEHASRYRRTLFVDVRRRSVVRIDSQRSCQRAIERFRPGPAYVVDDW